MNCPSQKYKPSLSRFLTNLALCDLILGLKLPIFFLVTLGYKSAWIFSDPTVCLIGGVADSFAFRIVVAGNPTMLLILDQINV